MFSILESILSRQDKAMDLLHDLLREEFSLLKERDTDAIMTLEFSIHELLRQLATEKEGIIHFLGGGKLRDYAQMLPDDKKNVILHLWHQIDKKEQNCSKQASRNTQLSLGLLDQSKAMLDYLHERIVPPQRTTYSRKGMYTQTRPQPSLINGRF